ncbi:hypothetical protein D1AOALGA4SA_3749 [Olavius algarvensis Delta 1 endosymbiont]|nr:hypothetical protein D1AOALGA4SA_3749 [Olavius algarvensis Delta 1 endosymbiont]
MPEPNLFRIFVSRLNKLSIPYMITGAVASIIYGEPRLTNDIDLVIDMNPNDVEPFSDMFPIEDFYCPPPEVIRLEIARHQRGHFNLIHHETGFKADIYASGRDELHRWGLNNRKSVDLEGEEFWLAPIEYVILRKLEYYREGESEKHLRDISSILEFSSNEIDFKLLEAQVIERALQKEWTAARSF